MSDILSVCFPPLECRHNTYGQDCRHTCGNCTKGEQCNHVKGSCLNGCDDGMKGDECDAGNFHKICGVFGIHIFR